MRYFSFLLLLYVSDAAAAIPTIPQLMELLKHPCGLTLDVLGYDPQKAVLSNRFQTLRNVAHSEHPHDALLRGNRLVNSAAGGQFERLVCIDRQGRPSNRNIPYPGIRLSASATLNTLWARNFDLASEPAPELVLLTYPGIGLWYSHMGSFFPFADLVAQINRVGVEGAAPVSPLAEAIHAALVRRGVFLRLGIQLADLPGHGSGPTTAAYATMPETLRFFAQARSEVRQYLNAGGASHVPIAAMGRSASNIPLLEDAMHAEGSLAGIVAMSPTHPDLAIGFASSLRAAIGEINESVGSSSILNPEGLLWMLNLRSGATFHRRHPFLPRMPVAVLTGGRDEQVSPQAREWFDDAMDGAHRLSHHYHYPHHQHDTLTLAYGQREVVTRQARRGSRFDGSRVYENVPSGFRARRPGQLFIEDVVETYVDLYSYLSGVARAWAAR